MIKFKNELTEKLNKAIESQDAKAFLDAISETASAEAQEAVAAALQDIADEQDKQILKARGVRMLTNAENAYYKAVIEAMKAPDFKSAVTKVEDRFPETVIDETFSDLEKNHDVIKHLDVKTVNAKVKIYFAKADAGNKAVWGKITGAITKEVSGGFEEIDAGSLKLSCFIPVPNALLDLGPVYLDQFVRTLLYEALANGIEDAVINNLIEEKGPIGMIANLDGGTTSTGSGDAKQTAYTAKTAVALTEWTPKGLSAVMTQLSKTRNGNSRPVNGMFMIVNPTDYFSIVAPAMIVRNALGEFVTRSPYPVDIVQSAFVPSKKAIIGLNGRYALGLSTGEAGKLEFSDEFKFTDEVRTYKIKLYGNGQPKDNNSFVLCDIENLAEAALNIVSKTTAKVTEVPAAKS